MAFKINGVDILDPTDHRWSPREPLGYNGTGHPVYAGVREYELSWELTSVADYFNLQAAFSALSGTQTASLDLPTFFISGAYAFTTYSGCVLQEPEYERWFNGYYQSVKLLVTNIRP